ncbi:MAG: hypothetical protein M1144_05365 [Candidatus Thermoplasmatota archaeon]|jgi:proteasome alpha subunit|nr:hypothetical protein [Candidatus Thermoplasmatota archaeon]
MVELRTVIPEEIDRYLDSLVSNGPFNNKAELVRAALAAYTAMGAPMAQVFDKENIFSPDGRIYQTEYARESALRAPPSVGVVYDGGVVLATRVSSGTSVLWYPKLLQVNPRVAVSIAGVVSDGLMTLRKIRQAKPKCTDDLVDDLTEWFWENTAHRGRRPLGVFVLLATTLDGNPRLHIFEPSGACLEGRGIAIGRGYSRIQGVLNTSRPPRNSKEAESLVLGALGEGERWQKEEVLHLKVH